MDVTKEKLESILFTCGISSGPPVFIYYSSTDEDIYATLYDHKKYESDEVIHIYYPKLYDEITIFEKIKNFKSKSKKRDFKINKILGE